MQINELEGPRACACTHVVSTNEPTLSLTRSLCLFATARHAARPSFLGNSLDAHCSLLARFALRHTLVTVFVLEAFFSFRSRENIQVLSSRRLCSLDSLRKFGNVKSHLCLWTKRIIGLWGSPHVLGGSERGGERAVLVSGPPCPGH